MNNCILTAASQNISQDLCRFLRSARKHHPNDNIVVMMPDYSTSTEFCAFLKQEYKTMVGLYGLSLCSNLADLMTMRFRMYKQYLDQVNHDRVFMCDCRDLHFQGSIFDYSFNTDIVCFQEHNKIKDNPIANGWLNIFADPKVKEQMGNSYNLCLGTLLGTQEGTNKFIEQFLQKMFDSKLPLNNDQIIFNYMIHTNSFVDITHTIETNTAGPVATIGDQDAHSSVVVKEGVVYIGDHRPAVVHQYDRLPLETQNNITL